MCSDIGITPSVIVTSFRVWTPIKLWGWRIQKWCLLGASGIVKWGYQDNFKSVYLFFYKKILRAQKHSQAKMNQQNKIKQNTKQLRQQFFTCAKTSKRVKNVCFALWCFLCARNLFVKNKQVWNCPDNLIILYY